MRKPTRKANSTTTGITTPIAIFAEVDRPDDEDDSDAAEVGEAVVGIVEAG